jgi:hypothetical protein
VKALFQAVVKRPAEQRDAFLAAATGDDVALCGEVESLLTSHTSDVSFLDQPPIARESVIADPRLPIRSPRYRGRWIPRGLTPSEDLGFPLYLFCTWTRGFERI